MKADVERKTYTVPEAAVIIGGTLLSFQQRSPSNAWISHLIWV